MQCFLMHCFLCGVFMQCSVHVFMQCLNTGFLCGAFMQFLRKISCSVNTGFLCKFSCSL